MIPTACDGRGSEGTQWNPLSAREIRDLLPARLQPDSPARPDSGHAPVGLYVHVPFCQTKCGYCDFYSIPLEGRSTGALTRALLRELHARVPAVDSPIATVFCGGGTPTLLPLDELAMLLRTISELTRSDPVTEFTVEANPGTVDDAKARLIVDSGVTRVSMGVQSFFEAELAALERIHHPSDIPRAVDVLRRNRVAEVNIDLIFGIPGQSAASWRASLTRAIELGVDHVSCYGLMYEPGTRLTAQRKAGRVTPCDESLEADMYLMMLDTLTAAGFEQYEVSNFAQPGCRCAHNLIYWRNQPYVGVGPSASGCDGRRRYKNVADVGRYVRMIETDGVAEGFRETIGGETLMLEMVMLQLRLVEGLSIDDFRVRTGCEPRALFGPVLDRFVTSGHLTATDTRIALTREGFLVADSIITALATRCGTGDWALPVM
jgi:oxygen-independent coproporphyrinogen-3 oxidase